MMNLSNFSAFLAFLLIAVCEVQAQTAEHPYSLNMTIGRQYYHGDLGNEILNLKNRDEMFGVGFAAYLNRYLDFAVEGQYIPLDFYNGPTIDDFSKRNTSFETDNFNISAMLRFKPIQYRLSPYAAIGVGANFLKDASNTRKVGNQFAVSMPLGVGLNYQLSDGIGLNAQALYHRSFSDGIDNFPLGARQSLQGNRHRDFDGKNHDDFFTTSVGVVFSFGGDVSEDKGLQDKLVQASTKNEQAAQYSSKQANNALQQVRKLNDRVQALEGQLKEVKERNRQQAAVFHNSIANTVNYVHFVYDQSTISPTDQQALDSLAEIIKKSPRVQLHLLGRTDKRGSEAYNKTLANRRVESVKRYLQRKGVRPSQITIKILGESNPLMISNSRTARAQNRTVQLILQYVNNPDDNN